MLLKNHRFKTIFAFCRDKTIKRQIIVPEDITFSQIDDFQHIETPKYSFLKRVPTKKKQLMVHKSNTPASLLIKDHLHLFEEGMPEANMNQSFKAFQKLLQTRYKKSFTHSQSGLEIYHLQRRIKGDIRLIQNNIGVLHGRHKHYPIWIPYKEYLGIKTQQNYQKQGVRINLLKQSLFQKGKMWMPTRQNYLNLLDSYLKSNTYQLNLIKTIADIGIGSGVLSFILAQRIKKYEKIFGFDINPNAVQASQINALKLNINNFQSYQLNIGNENDYSFLQKKYNLPKTYDMIISNPPWIVAKKISSEEHGFQQGVYDQKQKFVKGLLKFTKDNLKKEGKLILLYSTLSNEIGLTKNTIQSLSNDYKLKITGKLQIPYTQKIDPDDNLQMFKQKAKICLYEITHN